MSIHSIHMQMVKMLIISIVIAFSSYSFAQKSLIIEGTVVNDTTTGSYSGVNIPRLEPTFFTYRNNSVTTVNSFGYMLQAGDEKPGSTNNNLDGETITGNMFTWNGTDSKSITHAVFTGYNINATLKYNYLNRTPMGLLRKSNGMTNSSGGVAYNIVINPKVAFAAKGINNVNVYNNTFYTTLTASQSSGRALVDVYANTDNGLNAPSNSIKVHNNIFYTKYQTINISVENSCLPGFESDYNVFWCEAGEPIFVIAGAVKTFTQWQALGYDTHSKVINPDFINFTDLVPRTRLNFGTDLGRSWQTGLSVDAVWGNTDPKTTEQNGKWQVGARIYDAPTGYHINGSFMYNNIFSTVLDSMWVKLSYRNITIDSALTDYSGHYLFSNVINGTYTIYGFCTKPWNGVNATDAILIQRHSAGLELLTNPVSRLAADVNYSNTIDATDADEVKRRFTGIDTSFAKGDWIFAKPSGDNTVIVNNSNVAEDFYGLCVGDVNGSLLPLPGYNLKANKVSITHSGVIEVIPGQDFFFPLRSITETRVNAISMVIPNSPELLEVLDIKTPVGFPTFTHLNNNIRIAWSELQSLAMHQGDTLLLLKLKATGKFTGDLTINLVATEESELADETGNVIPFVELFAQTIKPLNANVAEKQNSILKNCSVFPNPASDLLNLELMANQKAKVNIEIRNMLGKIMKIDEIGEIKPGMSSFRINTADLPDGIYTFKLKLEGDKSKNSYLKKVVICRR